MEEEALWRWRFKGYDIPSLVAVMERQGRDSDLGRLAAEAIAMKIADARAYLADLREEGVEEADLPY